MKRTVVFLILIFSLAANAGVSVRLRGKIISYSEHDVKVLSEGKVESIPMEYVPPALKNQLYKKLDKEVVIRLPEHLFSK